MRLLITLALCALCTHTSLDAAPSAEEAWRFETSSDGSQAEPRSESGATAIAGKLYVLGGRGVSLPVNRYDPATRRWSSLGAAPEELHHFQPVAIGPRIYVIGALTGPHPDEPSVASVHVLDTRSGEWSIAGTIPADRRRGSTTAVLYQGDIYISGGNTRGHSGGAVAWFDKFDPATGALTPLADAPNARDHASAVVIDGKLYVAGGRTTDLPNPFDKPVLPVDIYDFESGRWTTGTDIPTARAGAMNAAVGNEVIVAGGEITGVDTALAHVEAYNTVTDRWRRLADLNSGRHGAGAAILGDRFHTVTGSRKRGGENTAIHESLGLNGPIAVDTDDDGLDDDEELQIHGTDPEDADTDDDGLDDGDEIERNTDPQVADSDDDGLDDGVEVNVHGTDPIRADTDNDGVSDGAEVTAGTNPLIADDTGPGTSAGDETGTETGTDGMGGGETGTMDGDAGNPGTTGGETDAGGGTTAGMAGTPGSDSAGGEAGATTMGIDDAADTTDGDATPQGSSGGGMAGGVLLFLLLAAMRRHSVACGEPAKCTSHA